MAADIPNLDKALLQWVQTFHTDPSTTRLADLRDGHIIQQILHDIDPAWFPADGLPAGPEDTATAGNWVQRWQNLKHIQRSVDAYVRDVCGVEGADARVPDLEKVAQAEGDGAAAEGEVVQLLKGILRAAMYSPESNQRMGRVVVGLGADVAGTIAAAMASMEEERYLEEGGSGANSDGEYKDGTQDQGPATEVQKARQDRDLELEHEEKLISAHRIIRQLEESNAKAALELEDLRTEKKRIEDAFEVLKQDPQRQNDRRAEDNHLRELKDRSNKDKDYIAELETELETARSTAESQARQLDRFKGSADTVQKLKDDLQLLRAERDELASKTRTNENLRKKIQNMQDAEKQGAQLRDDLRTAQEQLAGLDSLKDRCEALQKANTENMNIIASSEQEIFDMRSARKRLEHELRVLGQKYDIARERQTRDQEAIADLEAKLAQLESSDAEGRQGLSEEMERAEDRPRPPSRKVSIVGPGPSDGILEERLAALSRRNKALEDQYLDLLSDKLGLETAIAEMRDGSASTDVEANIPFLEQRAKLQAITADLDTARRDIHQLTSQLAEANTRALALQEGEAAEHTDATKAHAELSAAYASLSRDAALAQADRDEHRALLRFALLSARGIGADDDGERRASERKLAVSLLAEARGAEDDEGVGDVADRVVARVEAARSAGLLSAAKKPSGPSAEEEKAVADVRRELDEARAEVERLQAEAAARALVKDDGGGARKDDEESQKTIAQLKRENALMSTAWFDLSARIQRENVILGRRRETPKSWIGKMRSDVGLGVTGIGR